MFVPELSPKTFQTRLSSARIQLFWLMMVILFSAIAPVISRNGETHQWMNVPEKYQGKSMFASGAANTHFSIFGADDRFEITNTRAYPWSAVALVRIYWTADDLVGNSCTGWMIGPGTLATAAHCIYQNGYPDHAIVKPAMNSDAPDALPFGSCKVIDGIVPDPWIQKHSIEYDYGVYHLDCSIGRKTGTLGFKVTGGDWSQKPVQLTGYPNDKPGRTMWTGFGKITSSSAKGMYYDVDMWPGQSGSPVWDTGDKDCPYCVVAINSSQFAAPAMNFGARIDAEAFQFLVKEAGIQATSDIVYPQQPETK